MWQNPQVKCGKIHDFFCGMIDTDATFRVKKARKLLPVNEFQKITTAFRTAKMTQKKPIPASPIVRISNALARAKWSPASVWEPRLIALVASKVRSEDLDFQTYEIPISELILNSEKVLSGKTYNEVSTIVNNVMGKVLHIQSDDGVWTKYALFSMSRYNPVSNMLEVRFDPGMKEHYLNLQKNFAKYSLLEFLLLPSVYSQRLFEILKSWSDKPEVELAVSYLKTILEVPKSMKNFAEFRRRVLEKAHDDITKYTSLRFEWEPIKKGRSVELVRFVFTQKKTDLVQKKNEYTTKEKQSKKNNNDFVKALSCAKEKNGECLEKIQKKSICEICKKLGMLSQ